MKPARNFKKLTIILIVILGSLVYSNSLFGSFHFDDKVSIINNGNIRDLSNLRAIWRFWPTRFLTSFSLAVNYHFGHLKVFGYHLFNLLIHLLSAILAWWLALLTLSTPLMRDEQIAKRKDIIALLAALVFLAPPIKTQAVNYIIQRATLLAAFFSLASLCLFALARLRQGWKCKILSLGSIIAAIFGMFTKEMAISLPFLILAYELCFFRTKKGHSWKYVAPFLVILLIMPLTMLITKSVAVGEM